MSDVADDSREVEDSMARTYPSDRQTLFGIQRSLPFTSSSHNSRIELFTALNAGIQYRSPLITIYDPDQLDRLALVQIWDIWRTWQSTPRSPSFLVEDFVGAIFDNGWTTRQVPINPVHQPLAVEPVLVDIGVIWGKSRSLPQSYMRLTRADRVVDEDSQSEINGYQKIDKVLRVEYRLIGQPDVLLWKVDSEGHMEEAEFILLHEEHTQLTPDWEVILRAMAHQEMIRAINKRNKARAVYLARCAIRAWAMGDVRGQYAGERVNLDGNVADERRPGYEEVDY